MNAGRTKREQLILVKKNVCLLVERNPPQAMREILLLFMLVKYKEMLFCGGG